MRDKGRKLSPVLCALSADNDVLGFKVNVPQLERPNLATTTTTADRHRCCIEGNSPGLIRLGRSDDLRQLLNGRRLTLVGKLRRALLLPLNANGGSSSLS